MELGLHGLQVIKGCAQHILHRRPGGIDGNLGDQPQAFARGEDHLAAVGFLLAGEDTEKGGLSRPVSAQDAHPLAGVHLKGEPIQHRLAHLIFFL